MAREGRRAAYPCRAVREAQTKAAESDAYAMANTKHGTKQIK